MESIRGPQEDRLADRVVAAARRGRLRRSLVVVAAVLGVGAAVGVPLYLTSSDRPGSTTVGAGSTGSPSPTGPSTRALVYAAVLHARAGDGVVYVRDHVCESVARAPSDCNDGLIPPDVQAEVTALLGDRIKFVRHLDSPMGAGEPTVYMFGRLDINGDAAEVGFEVLCGPLCGSGETLIVAELDDGWQVTGGKGPAWIS